MQDEVGLMDTQRMLVRDMWRRYAQNMLGVTAERAVRAADLTASLALQQETYIHLLRVFAVHILTPFQVQSDLVIVTLDIVASRLQ